MFSPRLKVKILRVIAMDVIVIASWTYIIVSRQLSLLPTALIGYATLFVANVVLVLRAVSDGRPKPNESTQPPHKLLWFSAAVFTLGAVAMIISLIGNPNVRTGVQAALATLISGYVWFLLHQETKRSRRPRGDDL